MVNNDDKIAQTSIEESSINFDERDHLAHILKTLNQTGYMLCYNCHKIIPSDSEYCPFCGNLLFITCPKCEHRHSSEYPICNKCGTDRKTYIVEQKRLEQQEVEEQRRRSEQQRIEEQRRRDAEEKRRQEELRQLEEKRCREEAEARRLAEERRRLELKKREDKRQNDARIIWERLTGSVDGTKIIVRRVQSYLIEETETSLKNIIVPWGVKCLEGLFGSDKEFLSLRIKTRYDIYNIRKICSLLQSIEIPNSVTSIGDYAFSRCISLQNINIPDSITNIGSYAFANCSDLTTIEIPDSVKSIGEGAFTGCSQLVSFKSNVFCPRGERYLIAGDTLVAIAHSRLDLIEIPDIVKRIGDKAFSGCSFIKHICVPEGVESFGSDAFSGCTSLCDIVIPNSVKSIEPTAFAGCTELRKIIVPKGSCEHFISILPEWIQNQIQIEEE